MPLTRDLLGRLVGLPTSKRVREANFLDGALPSWLVAGSGTASFSDPATTDGKVILTTGAVSGNAADLITATGYSTSGFAAILLELEGLSFSSQNVQAEFGIFTSPAGAVVWQNNSDTETKVLMGGNTVTVPYQIINGGNQAQNRRNVALLLIPGTKELYVMENDQVMVRHVGTAFTGGSPKAYVRVTTRAAAPATFRLGTFRLSLYQY